MVHDSIKISVDFDFGTSKAKSMDLLSKELGEHESIDFIGITGSKFMYIADLSEPQDLSVYVPKTAQLNEPTIGLNTSK